MEAIKRQLDEKLAALCDSSSPGAALRVMREEDESLLLTRGLAEVEIDKPISAHSAFDAGSIAKTVTGICVAMLEDEGGLATGTSIRGFLPELSHYAGDISVEHLLRHESGLHNYTTLLYLSLIHI